jgi:hypothetical protein
MPARPRRRPALVAGPPSSPALRVVTGPGSSPARARRRPAHGTPVTHARSQALVTFSPNVSAASPPPTHKTSSPQPRNFQRVFFGCIRRQRRWRNRLHSKRARAAHSRAAGGAAALVLKHRSNEADHTTLSFIDLFQRGGSCLLPLPLLLLLAPQPVLAAVAAAAATAEMATAAAAGGGGGGCGTNEPD